MAQWLVAYKKADFKRIGERFGIDQVTARIIRNRGLTEEPDIRRFLSGGMDDLFDPHQMKDGVLFADILAEKIRAGKHIRVIGDYDIDGVMSAYIWKKALLSCGAVVSAVIPDRVRDGYGLNSKLLADAASAGVDTIVTCDNGIAAIPEIAFARSLGMTVLVTDHHAIPFEEEEGGKRFLRSEADAVVNPHQPDCGYPYKELCGAAVAWKEVQLLYERMGYGQEAADVFLENVAFATVGDVMPLTGENRILVKEGLKRIHHTKNLGMLSLIAQCGLTPEEIGCYHFGFVLGPCINAAGRLDTAELALELLFAGDAKSASLLAAELVARNNERKEKTNMGVEEAERLAENGGYLSDTVLVLYLPEVHESIAGIIAGRIRERYYRPTYILTKGKDGVKGSGRSVEEYSMYERLCRCSDLLTRFGGHPMAAGLSLPEEKIGELRRRLNEDSPLSPEVLTEKLHIDVPMPVDYVSMELVRQFELLAPFGKDNPRPLFADRNLSVSRMWLVGKNKNVLRLSLISEQKKPVAGIFFGDTEVFFAYMRERFGEAALEAALGGRENALRLSVVYVPKINVFRGEETLQFEIVDYR